MGIDVTSPPPGLVLGAPGPSSPTDFTATVGVPVREGKTFADPKYAFNQANADPRVASLQTCRRVTDAPERFLDAVADLPWQSLFTVETLAGTADGAPVATWPAAIGPGVFSSAAVTRPPRYLAAPCWGPNRLKGALGRNAAATRHHPQTALLFQPWGYGDSRPYDYFASTGPDYTGPLGPYVGNKQWMDLTGDTWEVSGTSWTAVAVVADAGWQAVEWARANLDHWYQSTIPGKQYHWTWPQYDSNFIDGVQPAVAWGTGGLIDSVALDQFGRAYWSTGAAGAGVADRLGPSGVAYDANGLRSLQQGEAPLEEEMPFSTIILVRDGNNIYLTNGYGNTRPVDSTYVKGGKVRLGHFVTEAVGDPRYAGRGDVGAAAAFFAVGWIPRVITPLEQARIRLAAYQTWMPQMVPGRFDAATYPGSLDDAVDGSSQGNEIHQANLFHEQHVNIHEPFIRAGKL